MNQATAVLFDLDGTLADTAPDLINALNKVLVAHNKPRLALQQARPYVSRGARGLLLRGFGLEETAPEYDAYVEELLFHYRQDLCVKTRVFKGMDAVLDWMDQRAMPWGVVTNKATEFAEPLLKKMQLYDRTHTLVCGDTTAHRKPYPEPLLFACQQAKMNPATTLYVGDDPRDVEAAIAAKMPSVAVRYGYYDKSENIDEWGADLVIDHPFELIQYLQQ